MSHRTLYLCVAALLASVPAAAQQRGTLELGAFGSAASFDRDLSLKTGFGGGARAGMYLDRTWSLEFEDAEMRATRPNGLRDVNVGLLSGRLVNTPARLGIVQLIAGVGLGVSTETNFLHSYGVDALIGGKVPINDNVAFRVDGVLDWLANEDFKSYRTIRMGFSFYRHPAVRTESGARTASTANTTSTASTASTATATP